MNRREALAALVALPALEHISVAKLEPSDVIVAECSSHPPEEAIRQMKEKLKEIWPNHRVIICSEAVRLKVLRA